MIKIRTVTPKFAPSPVKLLDDPQMCSINLKLARRLLKLLEL